MIPAITPSMNDSMKRAVITHLEMQKSVLIQELHTYQLTEQEDAVIETKRDLDDVVKQILALRRSLGCKR